MIPVTHIPNVNYGINAAVQALFSGGAKGVWYDPSNYTTLFQDSAGTTPVTAVEQPVGLMLDKSQGLVLGPELVTNGDFSNGTTGWTATQNAGTATITTDAGRLKVSGDATATYPRVFQNYSLTIGKRYLITATFDKGTATEVYLSPEAGTSVRSTAVSGVLEIRYVATAIAFNVSAGIWDTGGQNKFAFFDNISVKELPGNHAFQSTSASRPVLSARYNLLTKTEQFDDAVWTKFRTTISANAAVAPNGTTTADKMVEDGNTNSHVIDQNGMGYAVNAQNTITVYAKESERKYLNIAASILGAGTSYFVATFDVSAGTVVKSANAFGGTLVSTAITSEGNGWYRCVVTGSFNAGSQIRLQVGISNSSNPTYGTDGGVSYTGDGTSGIFIWGAQLETAT